MYPRAHCTGVGGHSIPLHLAVTGVCALSNEFEIRGECSGETSHCLRRERMTRAIDTQPRLGIAF